MDMPDVTAFLVVCTIALALAEMSVRQTATLRWTILATLWVILVAMIIWLYTG